MSKKGIFVNLLLSSDSAIYSEVYCIISFTLFTSSSAVLKAVLSYEDSIANDTDAIAL